MSKISKAAFGEVYLVLHKPT